MPAIFVDFNQILSFLAGLGKGSNIKDNGNASSGFRADTCRQKTEGQTDRQGSC